MKLLPFLKLRPRSRAPKLPFDQRVRLYAVRSVLAVVFFAAAAGLFALGQRADAFVRKSDFFRIENVLVQGASQPVEQEIRAAIGDLETEGESNLFFLDTTEAEVRIEQLPRVRDAKIQKELPRTLTVTVEERTPLVAGLAGGLFWLDEHGVLIDRASSREVAASRLPILTGLRGSRFVPGMQLDQPGLAETLQTIRFLQENDPDLASRFAEWHLNTQNEIIGIMKPGVEVRFGAGDPLQRLPALSAVLAAKPELKESTYLDLRFDSQVVAY
jgi:cell division septal protein FtsQ